MEEVYQSEDGRKSVSASPDFAQVYTFIQTFGPRLDFPQTTLKSLEDFFVKEYNGNDNQLAFIHWRLANTTLGYRMNRSEWQRSAIKCARRHRLCADNVSYHELPAQVRLRLFRLCCEDQFDYNMRFKSELKREEMEAPHCRPLLGCDSTGQKHWLLKDSLFDIRLYGESRYDVEPPKRAQWVELARSLDELAEYIAELESTRVSGSASQSRDTHVTSGKPVREEKKSKKQNTTKKSSTKKPSPAWDGDESIEGCIKCRKDINYSQMLLCDECDRECHTYCQYPRLWKVPRGKWICPICTEGHLVEELKRVHTITSAAKMAHERTLERKERSIARLQRTGLLLQNIILDEGEEDASKRSRRSRKEINYAELNDIPLPPLGRRDYVGSDWSPPPARKRRQCRGDVYIQEDYLAPRIRSTTRRFRGSPIADSELVESASSAGDQLVDVTGDIADAASTNSEQTYEPLAKEELTPPSEIQSNGHCSPCSEVGFSTDLATACHSSLHEKTDDVSTPLLPTLPSRQPAPPFTTQPVPPFTTQPVPPFTTQPGPPFTTQPVHASSSLQDSVDPVQTVKFNVACTDDGMNTDTGE